MVLYWCDKNLHQNRIGKELVDNIICLTDTVRVKQPCFNFAGFVKTPPFRWTSTKGACSVVLASKRTANIGNTREGYLVDLLYVGRVRGSQRCGSNIKTRL